MRRRRQYLPVASVYFGGLVCNRRGLDAVRLGPGIPLKAPSAVLAWEVLLLTACLWWG